MSKKILVITALFVGIEYCMAMGSPRTQFITFINEQIINDIQTIKTQICDKARESEPSRVLFENFMEKFASCFDGETIPVVSSYTNSDVLFSAARAIGLGYLQDAQVKDNLESINIALAFLKSVPAENFNTDAISDTIDINYVDIAQKEKDAILRRETVRKQVANSNPGLFFQ